MAPKTAKPINPPGAFAYFPDVEEDRRPATPQDLKTRRPWKSGETIRALEPEVTTSQSTETVWLEHRRHDGLMFRVELDGAGEIVSFVIRPLAFTVLRISDGERTWSNWKVDDSAVPDASPRLSAALFRDLPLGQLRTAASTALGQLHQMLGVAAPPTPPVTRQSSLSDLDLARLSADWVAFLKAGTPRPMDALKDKWMLSYNGAIHRKRTAVRRGLLTPTTKGRPGGSLTSLAQRILAEATEQGADS